MRRAWWFLVRVKGRGTAEAGKEQVGQAECTVPATKLDEAMVYLEEALHAHGMEVIDILLCERYDLDDWNTEDAPVGSAFWRHVSEVVTRNEAYIHLLTLTGQPTAIVRDRRVWVFLVRLRVLKGPTPDVEGKLAWRCYHVPERTLPEALATLRQDIKQDGTLELVEIVRFELLDLEDWDFEQWPKGSDAW